MPANSISMVQECVDRYEAETRDDGSVIITIDVPQRFADLWLIKLSDLRTSEAEIEEYEPEGGA